MSQTLGNTGNTAMTNLGNAIKYINFMGGAQHAESIVSGKDDTSHCSTVVIMIVIGSGNELYKIRAFQIFMVVNKSPFDICNFNTLPFSVM